MRLALFQPDQAGNVGAAMRLAACLGVPLDVIEPCGFPWGERAMRRAGMDYAEIANVARHSDWNAFLAALPGRLVLLTTRDFDTAELRKNLADAGLPNLWIPRIVKKIEAIPVLGTGKLDLKRCKELAAA